MPMETIDLTYFLDSPPSISSPMIHSFDSTNPNLHHQHQTTLPSAPGHAHHSHQMITTNCSQTGTHGGSLIARVLRPLPGSNTMPFPSGSRHMVSWSQTEHEYGQGRWSKIAENYVCNKTPQQVQSYAASFFRHLPDEYVNGLKKRKHDSNGINLSSGSYYSMHNMIANNDTAKETLTLFPVVPTYHGGEASSSNNNTNNYEANTSMTLRSPSASDGEVDLELRLALS